MKQYDCLTENSSEATAIYVPYYAGIDIGRNLWGRRPVAVRDSMMKEVLHWVRTTPEWEARDGRDHFIVSGRTTWDSWRATEEDWDWGTKFMLLPETRNMTVLDVESNKWQSSEFAIPYPTYFHPSKEADIIAWQDKVQHVTRPYLFSFAGARRKNHSASGIRNLVIEQCIESPGCKLLDCGSHTEHKIMKCQTPSKVMGLFMSSMFCVQPKGDTLTRRSLFDSMLAGCIPVFFLPGSAYEQYRWHLPRDYEKYSVYIPEDEVLKGAVNIQDVLLQYTVEQIKEMREELIKMIPTLVYNNPRYKVQGVRDAFDVTVDRVIQRTLQLIATS